MLQDAYISLSVSEVLAEGKKRELISRVRSVKITLEGNSNKPWYKTGEGKEALKTLKRDVEKVLTSIKRLESKGKYLEELVEALDMMRSSTRKVVDIIK